MTYLINELCREGKKIIITAVPEPEGLAIVCQILTYCDAPNLINLDGETSLTQFATLIDPAELFIGVDPLPMHIAAALETAYTALLAPLNEVMASMGSRRRNYLGR